MEGFCSFLRSLFAVILSGQAANNNRAEIFLGLLTCYHFFFDAGSQVALGVQQVAFTNIQSHVVFVSTAFDAIHTFVYVLLRAGCFIEVNCNVKTIAHLKSFWKVIHKDQER